MYKHNATLIAYNAIQAGANDNFTSYTKGYQYDHDKKTISEIVMNCEGPQTPNGAWMRSKQLIDIDNNKYPYTSAVYNKISIDDDNHILKTIIINKNIIHDYTSIFRDAFGNTVKLIGKTGYFEYYDKLYINGIEKPVEGHAFHPNDIVMKCQEMYRKYVRVPTKNTNKKTSKK